MKKRNKNPKLLQNLKQMLPQKIKVIPEPIQSTLKVPIKQKIKSRPKGIACKKRKAGNNRSTLQIKEKEEESKTANNVWIVTFFSNQQKQIAHRIELFGVQ